MSILADRNTKVVIQGVTGEIGKDLAINMLEMGTNVIGGVSPGKGGDWVLEGKLPIFDSLRIALKTTDAEASVVVVSPQNAYDAICEGVENSISLIVCITEGLPKKDVVRIKHLVKGSGTILIGPNSPGIFSPGEAMLGIVPGIAAVKGNVGIISRSGSLGYEVMNELSKFGLGISTFIGLGADSVITANYSDILPFFEEDPDTEKIIIIDEFFGQGERNAAKFISQHFSKPVVAMVVGKSSPAVEVLDHAGVGVSNNKRNPDAASMKFEDVGALIAATVEDIPDLILKN